MDGSRIFEGELGGWLVGGGGGGWAGIFGLPNQWGMLQKCSKQ